MIRKLFNNFTYLVSGSAREFDVEQRLFNIATFISVLVAFISILININLGLHYVLHIIIGFGAALLTYIFIRARIYKKFHIWLFIFSALAILSGSWLYNEGPLGSINYLYILALVIFLSVTKRKKHAIVSIVFFLNLIVLYLISFYYPNLIHPYESLEVRNSDLLFTYIYVVVFSALVFSSLRMNYENEKQTVELQNKKIEKQHNQIKDSISYAKHIQTALLQDRDEIKMLFDNSFVFWQPKDIVSGDFYWFKPNPLNSDKIFCTVADCTGHGVPGALLSMLGISYLNEIVLQQPDIEVSDILCRMRGKIKTNLRQHSNQSEFQDGIDMAFCVIDKVSKKLEYAGANNSLYIIRNKKIMT